MVVEALRLLDTFRPTEAEVIRREIARLRRHAANKAPTVTQTDKDNLAAIIDTTRQRHLTGSVPARVFVEAVVAAGWKPTKGKP